MTQIPDQFLAALQSGNFSVDENRIRIGNQVLTHEQIQGFQRIQTIQPNSAQQKLFPQRINHYVYVVRNGKAAQASRTTRAKLSCDNNPVSIKSGLTRILYDNKETWTVEEAVFGWNEQKLDSKQKITTPSETVVDYDCRPGTVNWKTVQQFTLKQVPGNEKKSAMDKKVEKNIKHSNGVQNQMVDGEKQLKMFFGDRVKEFNQLKRSGHPYLTAKYRIGVKGHDINEVMKDVQEQLKNKNQNKNKNISTSNNNNMNNLQETIGMMCQMMVMQQLNKMQSAQQPRQPQVMSMPSVLAPQPPVMPRASILAPPVIAQPAIIAAPPNVYQSVRGVSGNVASVRTNPLGANPLRALLNTNNNNNNNNNKDGNELESFLSTMLNKI